MLSSSNRERRTAVAQGSMLALSRALGRAPRAGTGPNRDSGR